MLKSSLIEIMKSFSPKEIKEFGEYIRSPFFNKNEELIELYEVIKAGLKSSKPGKLEKEYVYKKLFNGGKYNDGKMRLLMLNLARLAEGYLVQLNISDELNGTKLLVNELNKRNLRKNFEKSIKRFEELTGQMEFKDILYFYNRYVIAGEKDIFYSRERRMLNVKDAPDDSLLHQSEYVALFFLLVYFDRCTYLLNRYYPVKIDIKNFEGMVKYLSEKYAEDSAMLMLKYESLKLMLSDSDEDYFNLKKFALENIKSISKHELYNSVIRMQNFCHDRYHNGNDKFLKEALDLEKVLMAEDAVVPLDTGYLSPVRLKNTIVAALKLKENEWAKEYLEKYKHLVSPEHRDSAYNYCSARLEFEKGNFSGALEKLSFVQNEDLYYKIEIKVFLLKIYYELDMEGQAMDLCNTFRQFLSNNKLLRDIHIQTNSNFIKLVTRLFRAKNSGNAIEAKLLVNEIGSTQQLVGKDWLIATAEELAGEKVKA